MASLGRWWVDSYSDLLWLHCLLSEMSVTGGFKGHLLPTPHVSSHLRNAAMSDVTPSKLLLPWAEYDILQSQWLCDVPEMWCHTLETAVHVCVCVRAHARVHAYWCMCKHVCPPEQERQVIIAVQSSVSDSHSMKSFHAITFLRQKTGVKLPAGSDCSLVLPHINSSNNPLHSAKPHQISCALTPRSGDKRWRKAHSCHC